MRSFFALLSAYCMLVTLLGSLMHSSFPRRVSILQGALEIWHYGIDCDDGIPLVERQVIANHQCVFFSAVSEICEN